MIISTADHHTTYRKNPLVEVPFFLCVLTKQDGKTTHPFLHLETDSYSYSHETVGGKKSAHNTYFLRCSSRTGKSPLLHLEVKFERAVLSNIMTNASLPTIHNLEVEDFKVGLYIKKIVVGVFEEKMNW